MPLSLSELEKEDIFNQIRKAFSDFPYFDMLIKDSLRKMIEESTKRDFGVETTKALMKDYVDMSLYQNEKQKEELKKVEQILTASHVLLHSKSTFAQSLLWPDVNKLLSEYPEFSVVTNDPKELQYLLNFRNFMAVALTLLNASGNKIFLLRVIERLEGSGNEYITGSGQKSSVTRRIEIYAKEGNVKSKKAGGRKPKDNNQAASAGPSSSSDLPIGLDEQVAKKRKVNSSMNDLLAAVLMQEQAIIPPASNVDNELLGPAYVDFDSAISNEPNILAEELLRGLSKPLELGTFSNEQELRLNRMFSDGSINSFTEEEVKRLANNA